MSRTPDQLIEDIKDYCRSLCPIFVRHHFLINFGAGKSEIVLSMRGRGKNQIETTLFVAANPSIPIEFDGRAENLLVAQLYRHVGSFYAGARNQRPEVFYRVSRCGEALAENRATFNSHVISRHAKLHIVYTVCLARLFYNCCMWHRLSDMEVRRIEAMYLKCVKIAIFGFNTTFEYNMFDVFKFVKPIKIEA